MIDIRIMFLLSGVIVFSLDSCNREKDKRFSEQVIGSRALDYNTERFTIMSSDFPNQESVADLVLDGNTLVVDEMSHDVHSGEYIRNI